METLETASNSSMLSDGSEYPHSNISSASGLSTYEDELRELKRLISVDPINDLKYTNKSPSNYSENSTYETNYINNSKLNHDTFRNNCNNWQIELENHKKIDKLIKHNTFLELELKSANDRIRDILKNNITFSGNFNNANNLRNQIVSLEKTNFDYNLQIQVLKKEVLYWRELLETSESSKRSLEKELVEATQDNKSKANCIIELKKKICQQHTDTHNLKQENVKLNNQILSLENDSDRLKKSEDWYKHHLHKNQAVKQDLLKECANLKSLNADKSKEIELLTFELNKWKNSCDELKSALNEMKLEQSNNYMQQISPPTESENEKLKMYYESIIADLGNEINRIKQSVHQHNVAFDQINQEKFELVRQVSVLQKKLDEKEIAVHALQNEKCVLNTKLSLIHENLNESDKNYMRVKNEKAAIEVELLALSKEKEIIEESVTSIREDLNKLICKYKSLQQQIHSKDIYIKQLEKEKLGETNYNDGVINILENICCNLKNLCENGEKPKNTLPKNSIIHNDKNVQNLLQSINMYIEKLCTFKKYYKEKQEFCANTHGSNLHKVLLSRLQKLENKCVILTKNNEESYSLLKLISSRNVSTNSIPESEEIKHLKAVIRANEIEMKEKQIRFETNNHTLLRKVKEHMRGRTEAEKHCTYLQELYDDLSSQYNMLRFRLSEMENEINMQAQNNNCNEHKCILNNNRSSYCSECNSKCERIKYLEKELNTVNEKNEQIVKEKDNKIIELEKKLQEFTHKYSSLENEHKTSIQKCEHLQRDLTKCNDILKELQVSLENTQKSLQNTEDKLLEMANKNSEQTQSIKKYENLLKDVTEKNEYLSKEVESLSSNLHQKNEELSNLEQKHNILMEETSNFQTTLTALRSDLQNIHSDMNAVTNDKHFLQRICNDLKFALNSSINQNKVLKEQLQTLSLSKREYSSLPDEFLSLPNIASAKYDDKYICKLLEQTSDPSHELLSSIQNNLHLLKQELSTLQMRINEKNLVSS